MSLQAPEEHTSHELLELVAAALAGTADLPPTEVPGRVLDLCVDEGPFDFGALYIPDAQGTLEYIRGKGVPDDLRTTLIRGLGAWDRIEAARTRGKALVLSSLDTEDGIEGLEQALGADSALLVPLSKTSGGCPVLLLATVLHDVGGAGEALARALQATYEFSRERHTQLQRSKRVSKRWDRLVQAVSEALIFANPEGEIVQANAAASVLFGRSTQDLVGCRLGDLLPGINYRSEEWTGTAKGADEEKRVTVRTATLPKDEEGQSLYLHAIRLLAPAPAARPPLGPAAPLDKGTGLPDKGAFLREVEREMGLARRYNSWCSVLVMEVDGMSPIRQTLGDETVGLLRGIAEALKGRLRRADRLGRMGSDGFGILLSRADREQARGVAKSMLDLVKQRSTMLGHPLTASVGISYFPDDAETPSELTEVAFGAMRLAKRDGGDAALVWSPSLMQAGRAPTVPVPPSVQNDGLLRTPRSRRAGDSDTSPFLPAVGSEAFPRVGEDLLDGAVPRSPPPRVEDDTLVLGGDPDEEDDDILVLGGDPDEEEPSSES